jgi:uncharacterized membrane protein
MSDRLHPAVRDVAATGAVSAGAGVAVLAVALAVDTPAQALLIAAVAIVVAAVLAPLRMPRGVREILTELRPAPELPVDEGLSRAVWWSVPVIAAGVGVAALLSVSVAACGGVLLGIGVSEVAQAWWLRRWERLNGMRLLYRARYRWAGTNGRVLGRGWFDPANFVASD